MTQPHSPHIESATLTGDQITFRIDVSDFKTTEGPIEISGQATQSGGAFANIYAITQVPAVPDVDGGYYVDVTANTIPPHRFRNDMDVTVSMRVAKFWVTVLGEQAQALPQSSYAQRADEGTTWNQLRAASTVGRSWDEGDEARA